MSSISENKESQLYLSTSNEHTANSLTGSEAEEPEIFRGLNGDVPIELEYGEEDLTRIATDVRSGSSISRRLTNAESLIAKAMETDEPLPKMGGGRDYPAALGDRESYIVSFEGKDDPLFPHNWPMARRVKICFAAAFSALALSLGSAMFTMGLTEIEETFGVGQVVATLGTSLYVFGFASGPIVWGPLSELYGRKTALLPSCFGYVCFIFGCATAKDLQTVMICRFFAGFIGSAAFVVSPAAMADLFGPAVRGTAMSLFAAVVFGGPMLGPIMSGFIVKNPHLNWRWTQYINGIFAAVALIVIIFLFEETSHKLILSEKAENLRRRTGNWGIQAPGDEVSLSFKEILQNNIARPLKMLVLEPIILMITTYNAFIYGLLYLLLTAIPMIFAGEYKFSGGVSELPYLSIFIGILLGLALHVWFGKRYLRAMIANGGKPIPEERLPPMMVGSIFFAVGLFWLGWTGQFPNRLHWMLPTVGAGFIGFGLILIFLPCINYIVDCYLFAAASALAANTLVRSFFGGAFPLFATQMFNGMQIKWACTLLGCVASLLIPVPFLFYKYGRSIRERSKYASVL